MVINEGTVAIISVSFGYLLVSVLPWGLSAQSSCLHYVRSDDQQR